MKKTPTLITVRNVCFVGYFPLFLETYLLPSQLLYSWKRSAFNIFKVHIKKCLYFCFKCILIEVRMALPLCDQENRAPPSSAPPCPPHFHPPRIRGKIVYKLGISKRKCRGPQPSGGSFSHTRFKSCQDTSIGKDNDSGDILFWLENVSVFGFNQNCS